MELPSHLNKDKKCCKNHIQTTGPNQYSDSVINALQSTQQDCLGWHTGFPKRQRDGVTISASRLEASQQPPNRPGPPPRAGLYWWPSLAVEFFCGIFIRHRISQFYIFGPLSRTPPRQNGGSGLAGWIPARPNPHPPPQGVGKQFYGRSTSNRSCERWYRNYWNLWIFNEGSKFQYVSARS